MNVNLSKDKVESVYPLLSNYLNHEYKNETITLEEIQLDLNPDTDTSPGSARGVFSVDSTHIPDDGVFHISSITADICMQQFGVIFGHMYQDLLTKTKEVYLIETQMTYKRPIRGKTLTIETEFTEIREGKRMIVFSANVVCNKNAFLGYYKWAIRK